MKSIICVFIALLNVVLANAQMYGVPNFKNVYEFTKNNEFTVGIEGPAVDKKGLIYVVNYQKEGTIGVVDYFGKVTKYLDLPEGSIGNSIVIDTLTNTMYIADYKGHKIYKCDMATKQLTVWAEDSRFNQPNDIVLRNNGDIYASDPDWNTGLGNIWLIKSDGRMELLESSMGATNGIAFSPDHKILYVTEEMQRNENKQRNIWAFDIDNMGRLENKRLLMRFTDFGLDGMKVDKWGNIYLARYGKGNITVINPKGFVIREIYLLGKKPTNLVFGGIDKKTVYVTMQDTGGVQAFRMPFLGLK